MVLAGRHSGTGRSPRYVRIASDQFLRLWAEGVANCRSQAGPSAVRSRSLFTSTPTRGRTRRSRGCSLTWLMSAKLQVSKPGPLFAQRLLQMADLAPPSFVRPEQAAVTSQPSHGTSLKTTTSWIFAASESDHLQVRHLRSYRPHRPRTVGADPPSLPPPRTPQSTTANTSPPLPRPTSASAS